jgi:hypothetical protein
MSKSQRSQAINHRESQAPSRRTSLSKPDTSDRTSSATQWETYWEEAVFCFDFFLLKLSPKQKDTHSETISQEEIKSSSLSLKNKKPYNFFSKRGCSRQTLAKFLFLTFAGSQDITKTTNTLPTLLLRTFRSLARNLPISSAGSHHKNLARNLRKKNKLEAIYLFIYLFVS